jgi:F0F1-type ATP synthase membrane subunit c/vacuolar-type H+-ATPase subunit K
MMERPTQQLAGARFRGLMIIWAAQFFSLLMFYGLARLTPVDERAGDDRTLLLALAAIALTTFAASFFVKATLVARAVATRRPEAVTSGYVAAFALCEACAILGVVAHFTMGARESIYFYGAAALGFLLHFPRRRHFEESAGDTGQSFTTTL